MGFQSVVRKLRLARSTSAVVEILMDSLRPLVGVDAVSYFRSDERGISEKESVGIASLAVQRYLERAHAGLRDPMLEAALRSGQAVQSGEFVGDRAFTELYRETARPWRLRQIASTPIVSSDGAVSAIT